jgi:hypothetical protein
VMMPTFMAVAKFKLLDAVSSGPPDRHYPFKCTTPEKSRWLLRASGRVWEEYPSRALRSVNRSLGWQARQISNQATALLSDLQTRATRISRRASVLLQLIARRLIT